MEISLLYQNSSQTTYIYHFLQMSSGQGQFSMLVMM